MDQAIIIQLNQPNYSRDKDKFVIDNKLFNCYVKYEKDIIFGFIGDGSVSDELTRYFSDHAPINDEYYDIELGVELLEIYPNLNSCSDYYLELKDDTGELNKVFISNSMAKVSYCENGKDVEILFNQLHKEEVFKNPDLSLNINYHIQKLKTFVTWQSTIKGKSVFDAFKDNLSILIDKFIFLLNELNLSYNLILKDVGLFSLVVSTYSKFTLPMFHFIVNGKDREKFAISRIATNPKGVAYIADNLNNVNSEKLKHVVKDNDIELYDKYWLNAQSFILAGELKNSLLSLSTSCELLLARYIRSKLIQNGVSKKKLKEAEKDITFSQMLNIHLYSLSPDNNKPNNHLIGIINSLRKHRNELIHNGNFKLTDGNMRQFLESVKELRKYILKLIEVDNI